nr:SDR family oxidoreductase [Psychromicrobium silvestre]
MGLTGKTVIVSGAASGIGRACARAFAEEGANLALIDIDERAGSALERELAAAVPCIFISADMTNDIEVAAAVDSIAGSFGGIDIAIGSAGISGPFGLGFEDISAAEFSRVMEVNVLGQFLLARQTAKYLRASDAGSLIFIASDSSFVAAPGMVPYNASKGAVLQLTRALSVELSPSGVRVNCVCPSIVDTPMARADLDISLDSLDLIDFPVQRPEQVANHVLYLASSCSAPVNGTSLVSDFGYLAKSSFPA